MAIERLCQLKKYGGGGGSYTETTQWTNSDPTQSMSLQNVYFDKDISTIDFDYIRVYFKLARNTTDIYSVDFSKEIILQSFQVTSSLTAKGSYVIANLRSQSKSSSGTSGYIRPIVINNTKTTITFLQAAIDGQSSSYSSNVLIPTKLTLIKY